MAESNSSDRRQRRHCGIRSLEFARLFGLSPGQVGSDLCEAVSSALPASLRSSYRIDALLSRGAYGVVFSADARAGTGEEGRGTGSALPARVAVKVQFVCPKGVRSRALCSAYGQRASGYETVRYEALQHARVYRMLTEAAAAAAQGGQRRAVPYPVVPQPLHAQRLIVGRPGQYPGVPPDGRRRLWISAMELMGAPTLRQTMHDARRRGTISLDAFGGVCSGVLEHVRALHDLGVTHGDLHTGNILVDEQRAAASRPWVVLIDLERSIPREFVEMAPGLDSAEDRAALWDVARAWDLKIFVESIVRLAESAGVYSSAASTSPASTSPASSAPPRQRFRRAVDLATVVLRGYVGGGALRDGSWLTEAVRRWVARALWLKKDSAASIPTEVLEELREALGAGEEGEAVARADREQHRQFFSLLRSVQTFYTTPERRRRPAQVRRNPPRQARVETR